MKTTRYGYDKSRLYIQHPEVGAITVSRFSDYPEGRPWFCSGHYYKTALSAVKDFIRRYNREQTPEELWHERMAEINYQAGYAYACGYRD